ncbi:MAG: hypothetical protein SOY99_00490 [Alloprevotella sp.]|nr:hypothetical protein [Alloprevotella sp.]
MKQYNKPTTEILKCNIGSVLSVSADPNKTTGDSWAPKKQGTWNSEDWSK